MKIVFSEKCLEYNAPGHIERPERVKPALKLLKEQYEFIEPTPATTEDLLSVHTKQHVDMIKNAKLESYIDGDTPAPENIYNYALLSAGAAIIAAKEKAFSFMRPPGHHAGKNGRAMSPSGFMYTKRNIELLLQQRYVNGILRNAGGRRKKRRPKYHQKEATLVD